MCLCFNTPLSLLAPKYVIHYYPLVNRLFDMNVMNCEPCYLQQATVPDRITTPTTPINECASPPCIRCPVVSQPPRLDHPVLHLGAMSLSIPKVPF